MKCQWETYKILQQTPDDAVLLGYNDTILCVTSPQHSQTALQLLPPNLAVLGTKKEVGDDVVCVKESCKLIRIRGSLPMLVNKATKAYLTSSIEHARQTVQSALLISDTMLYGIEEHTLPVSSDTVTSYQLASDLTANSGLAPIITREEECYLTSLDIDVMLLADVKDVVPLDAIISQFNTLITNPGNKALHFQPPGLSLPVTFLQSHLTEEREQLHSMFYLPDVSYFNPVQAVRTDKQDSEGRLVTPHRHVSGVKDSDVHTVAGDYCYHHYMQDKFNDSGWGCAYRSLQTLCSWFLYNGYTDKQAPSHNQIQQALVDMGDKPPKFVNSRQWIGSVEVGYVLDTYLGMQHRIQFVSSGEEMGMQGGLLSYHFKTQGTPVMIGGGVLAHTILGVRYDEVTGDTQFLILDPHYTGREDIDVILKEGWCGWKNAKFWDKRAHYNMCLPQRPPGI